MDVEIVEYRLEWPMIFEREKVAILQGCRPWVSDIQHVGSTSVPGLASKPILDIMPIVAKPRDGENAVELMTKVGYRYRGENGRPGRFYFSKIVHGRTVVHAHMYPQSHPDVRKLTAFRDYIRIHQEAALAYERLKRELASKHRNDREMYTNSKSAFINDITATALANPRSAWEKE